MARTKKSEEMIEEIVETVENTEDTVKQVKVTETTKEDIKTTKTIIIDRDRSGEDSVFVGVNGKNYLIKKGIPVEVPIAVAEVIMNSRIAVNEAYDYIDGAARRN